MRVCLCEYQSIDRSIDQSSNKNMYKKKRVYLYVCDNVVGSLVILWWVHFTIEFLIKSFNELENRVNVKVTYNGRFMHINVAM